MEREVVHKITKDMDPRNVACTTYQMRNPFIQFADAFASDLDVHCYHQHAYAADLCPKDGRVLDVCCGRGLLIPFLRYRAKPSLYCGVDVCPSNAKWKDGKDPRRESRDIVKPWPFETVFVESRVGEMFEPVRDAVGKTKFDLIVYTSSIEHMHIDEQINSLKAIKKLSKPNAVLYLSCPVTPEDKDGFDTQYAAHVYEPKMSEIKKMLRKAGFSIQLTAGLGTKSSYLKKVLKGDKLKEAERILKSQPREQALCTIAVLYPECATEVGIVARRSNLMT